MDINTLRSFSVVLVALAFAGICWWAFSPRRKKRFEEAANLPFIDDANHHQVNAGDETSSRRGNNNGLQPNDQKQGQS